MKIVAIVALAVFLSSCADYVSYTEAANMELVGFWHGFWHGIILPFSFIVSLFDSSVSVYAIYNNGGWYDFGFFLGVASAFSASETSTRAA